MAFVHSTMTEVIAYLRQHEISERVLQQFQLHEIDGLSLCLITEQDLRDMHIVSINERKHLIFLAASWRRLVERRCSLDSRQTILQLMSDGNDRHSPTRSYPSLFDYSEDMGLITNGDSKSLLSSMEDPNHEVENLVEPNPRVWKVLISVLYAFIVTGITSFVMVIAHERLPDMSKYPPLPDLLLDNLPHISWAFKAAELVCLVLLVMWFSIVFFHRHRLILIRRFFALTGTVFLLRSVTMLITSLSVPGRHLSDQCAPHVFKSHMDRFKRVWDIWISLGMSIGGIQTCGDYMFSGHTTMLTLLNFFITEYAPRRLQSVHTISWVLNLFGVFFILASHEHYSIDVFVACYVSSRLFLYYHCLANSRILDQEDKKRAMVWFPLFSFFEYDAQGIVPNTYALPNLKLSNNMRCRLMSLRKLSHTSDWKKVFSQRAKYDKVPSEPSMNGLSSGLIHDHTKRS